MHIYICKYDNLICRFSPQRFTRPWLKNPSGSFDLEVLDGILQGLLKLLAGGWSLTRPKRGFGVLTSSQNQPEGRQNWTSSPRSLKPYANSSHFCVFTTRPFASTKKTCRDSPAQDVVLFCLTRAREPGNSLFSQRGSRLPEDLDMILLGLAHLKQPKFLQGKEVKMLPNVDLDL